MHCTKCGNTISEGSAFCTNCGAPLSAPAPADAPASAAAPAYTYTNAYAAPFRPIAKREFVFKHAEKKVKTKALIAIVLTVVSLVIMFLAASATLNNPVWDVPLVKTFVDEDAREEMKDSMDEMDEGLEQLEEIIEEYEDDMDKTEKRLAKQLVSAMENFVEKPSLSNAKAFIDFVVDKMEDLDDATGGELGFVDEVADTYEQIVMVFDVVVAIIVISFLLAGVFIALGGLLQKTGFVITGLVLAIPVTAIFGGVVLMIAGVVVHAVMIAMCSSVNQEYNIFRMNPIA